MNSPWVISECIPIKKGCPHSQKGDSHDRRQFFENSKARNLLRIRMPVCYRGMFDQRHAAIGATDDAANILRLALGANHSSDGDFSIGAG